jgi:hypothetical protein
MRLVKQLLYGTLFLAIIAAIVYGVFGNALRPTPTCFDNRRNQGESDVDCGGPCQACEVKSLRPIEVISKTVFHAGSGIGYAFELVNPNSGWAATEIPYQVILQDAFGGNTRAYSGVTFAYAGELKYVVQPFLPENFRNVASMQVELGQPVWKQGSDFEKPNVDAQDVRTAKNGTQLTVTGKLVNQLSITYDAPVVSAVVFNIRGDIIGASRTQLERLGPLETQNFTVLFPQELSLYTPRIAPSVQFPAAVFSGETGDEVRKLQGVLLELGFLQRDPTGFYDVLTQDAVRQLQSQNGLEANGEFDEATRQFVNSLLERSVQQPSQQELDTGVDASKTRVFVEVRRQ